jgi:endonuclease G, mitochondrial
MRRRAILLFLALFLSLSLGAQQKKGRAKLTGFPPDTLAAHPEWPALHPGDAVVRHRAYALCYDDPHEQAAWVAYRLSGTVTGVKVPRTDRFRVDPLVPTGSASGADYAGTGFDRGHLAPANDMAWSTVAMSESFYYSNMSPQDPSFNRGIWKRLETLVHGWASLYGGLWIATGPVFSSYADCAGEVSVPAAYYKVVMKTDPPYECVGFILPNSKSALPLERFAVSVDEVENVTGIDFFSSVTDKTAIISEKILCRDCWAWPSRVKGKE